MVHIFFVAEIVVVVVVATAAILVTTEVAAIVIVTTVVTTMIVIKGTFASSDVHIHRCRLFAMVGRRIKQTLKQLVGSQQRDYRKNVNTYGA